ncbi:MAG: hypothetical protein RLZZ621_1063, partial [Gemmatimonadota bacterium]
LMFAAFWWNRAPRLDVDDAAPLLPVIPVDSVRTATAAVSPDGDSTVALIISNNIFSITRRPPATRFQLPPSDAESEVTPSAFADPTPGAMPMDVSAVPSTENVPALFGTMRANGGAMALLRLDASQRTPQLYGEGDRAGGFRVVRIDTDAVVLSGPSGPVTLRLARPDKEVP